jgi:uncharacterized protein
VPIFISNRPNQVCAAPVLSDIYLPDSVSPSFFREGFVPIRAISSEEMLMPRHLRPVLKTTALKAVLLGAFVAATLLASLQTSATHADEKPMKRTITVSATGTVEAEPDQARITSGVTTEATSAREALTGNSEAMTKVISQLKAKGIDAKDIQTASFNVEPLIDYSKDGQPPKTRGYRVTNQVVVLVRDLSRLGTVLDDVITAGANQVQGLSFEVSKADTLKDEARKEAVANALRRAKLLAAAAGAEVGEVLQMSEDVSSNPPIPYASPRFAKSEMSVPIERGTSILEARVTATWALK